MRTLKLNIALVIKGHVSGKEVYTSCTVNGISPIWTPFGRHIKFLISFCYVYIHKCENVEPVYGGVLELHCICACMDVQDECYSNDVALIIIKV